MLGILVEVSVLIILRNLKFCAILLLVFFSGASYLRTVPYE